MELKANRDDVPAREADECEDRHDAGRGLVAFLLHEVRHRHGEVRHDDLLALHAEHLVVHVEGDGEQDGRGLVPVEVVLVEGKQREKGDYVRARVERHLNRRQWCAEAWIFKPGERHRALRQGVRRVVYEQRAGEADGLLHRVPAIQQL